MPRASVLAATRRRRLAVAVVLGEKAVHDARAEEEPVVRLAPATALEGLHVHDVALDARERRDGPLRVRVDEPPEEPFGPSPAHAHRVGDGVHRPAAKERDVRHRVAAVDVQEAGEGHVPGAVASADRQDVDVDAAKVFGDAVELFDRAGRPQDAVVAQPARQAQRSAGVAQVAPALGVEDDSDARHRRCRGG